MSGPDDPTVPPPRRRPTVEAEGERRVPATGNSEPAERTEKYLRELRDAEKRQQQAVKDLTDLLEKRDAAHRQEIVELRDKLEQAHSTIRRLTSGQAQSVHDDAVLTETIQAMGRALRAEIEEKLRGELRVRVEAAGKEAAEVATEATKASGRVNKVLNGLISSAVAAAVVGALAGIQQSCQTEPVKSLDTRPALPQADPGSPHGLPR